MVSRFQKRPSSKRSSCPIDTLATASFPDKAIDLIDETGSRAKLQTYALPLELKAMEQELKKVSREKELAISMQNFEEAVRHREEEERLRKLLDESKREWKKNQEKNKPTIGKEEVAYVVSKMTGIPLFKLEEESNKLLRMENSSINVWSDRTKRSPPWPEPFGGHAPA